MPQRPRGPCTTRRRRTPSAQGRARAGAPPRREPAPRVPPFDGPRVVGRRPVRVVPERPERRGLARTLEPCRLVLAEPCVCGAHERRDREAARATPLQRDETRPHSVVERSLNVAGHDRVPFPAHLAPTVSPSLRRARGRRRVAAIGCIAVRARRDPRRVHGQERRLRAHVSGERHVRLHPGSSLRLHTAALRLLPHPDLLGGSLLVDRRGCPHRRRDRDCVDRVCDRPACRIRRRGARRRTACDAPSVSRLARRSPESRDPRPAARGGDRLDRDHRRREGTLALVGCGTRRDARSWGSSATRACSCSRSSSASG